MANIKAKSAQATSTAASTRSGFNWFRFWVRAGIAMLVFNIIAFFVTWYFILPRLHPPR
jgi:hypothetical protein